MAKDFNLFGAWSHFSDENDKGRGAKYNKVNLLFGAFRFEKAQKELNGSRRENSVEQSYLFGAVRHRIDRGNGVSKEKLGVLLLGLPLYRRESMTVKDGADYMKTTTTTAFAFHNKVDQEWKENGLTRNGPVSLSAKYKLDTKLNGSRSVYGDHMDGSYAKPKSLHKYAVKESLNEAKGLNLNNASVTGMTTGGIVEMAKNEVEMFRAIKVRKQAGDARIRKTAFRVSAFLTVLPFIVGFASSGLAVGPVAISFAAVAAGIKGYDWIRKGLNFAAGAELQGRKDELIGAVQRYETQTAKVGPTMQVDQGQIVNAFENLHQTMEKQHSGRKTQNIIELFGVSAASIGVGAAMAQEYPGVNWPGIVAGGLGLLHGGSRYQQAQAETNAMGVLAQRFGDTRQDIVTKKIVVAPAPKPGGP